MAPATRLKEFIDAAQVIAPLAHPLDKLGIQFVSWGGDVRQQRWWWNVDAFPPGSITVSVMQSSGCWFHWTVRPSEIQDSHTECLDDRDALQEYQNGFIGDADGALRAAALQPILAKQSNSVLLGSTNGYFLKNDLEPPSFSGLVDWFRIEAILPLDRKKLRAYLRDRDVGTLEIKTRRIDVPVDELRKEMKLVGNQSSSLLLTKCNGRAVALVAHRVTKV